MHYDLLIRNAHLHRQQDLVDIAVKDGYFASIAKSDQGTINLAPTTSATREIDVGGRLVMPPFIDAHVHLDAVLTVGQPRYNTTGTLLEGIQIWSTRKASLSREDVKRRALEAIRWEVAQGTLHIR
ncbi:MAG: cytosine deaminase, partial [Chloroflexi bacterium]|nr:cytosine deaminase [Chloroflexota bacterium]